MKNSKEVWINVKKCEIEWGNTKKHEKWAKKPEEAQRNVKKSEEHENVWRSVKKFNQIVKKCEEVWKNVINKWMKCDDICRTWV